MSALPSPGTAFHVRPLRRGDARVLDRIMAGMSTQSRYQRFHSPKPSLTPRDHEVLTSVDGRDHIALVALADDGAPLGVARAIRRRDDPFAAEIAVAIVDGWQRQGLGTQLVADLARRAVAVGIERLVALVLTETGLPTALANRGWRGIAREGHTLTFEANAWSVARDAG